MKTWTDWRSIPVVPLSAVPEGRVLAEGRGESTKVYEIAGHPDWLAKLYRQPLTRREELRLDSLIAMPANMSMTDVERVDRTTGWPVARITESGRTMGVVMAKAPVRFHASLKGVTGTPQPAAPLEIDWLVSHPEKIDRRGLGRPDMGVRTRALWEILDVGALFERHGLVYADWSYSNAFWALGTGEVFVIDMDTCGLGSRPWIESPGCEDPLFQDRSRPLTTYSDRYKVAVLALRCLTAERDDPLDAFRGLPAGLRTSGFGRLMKRMLIATEPTARPTIGELLEALEQLIGSPRSGSDGEPSHTTGTASGGRHPGGRGGGRNPPGPTSEAPSRLPRRFRRWARRFVEDFLGPIAALTALHQLFPKSFPRP